MLASLARAMALFGLFLTAVPATAQEPYRFSPVNQWDINRTASYWNPIIQYVSQRSGLPLQLKIGRTSADTTAYVLAQEVEFIFSNHMFNPQRMALGWHVFGRRNGPLLRGQIAVPADSPITSLDQLRDQEVAFAGNEAFVGHPRESGVQRQPERGLRADVRWSREGGRQQFDADRRVRRA